MKRKAYLVDQDTRTLILEESYDENGNVIHSIDYRELPPNEHYFEYDSNGKLIREREVQDGEELTVQTFEYDSDNVVVDEKLFIAGELYEHTRMVKTDSGFVRTMIQNDLEVERLERVNDGENWVNNFYSYDELLEKQEYTFDEINNTGEIITTDFVNDFKYVVKEKYNEKGDIILEETFNEEGSLLNSTETEIEKGLILKETVKDFVAGGIHNHRFYEYDENNNLINFEVRSSTGTLHSFHKRVFDNQNRLTEEIGHTNGYSNGVDGIYKNYDRFHILYEYE